MEYFGNALCVGYDELVGAGILTAGNLQKMAQRGKLNVLRQGGGPGHCALIAVDSLPERYRAEVKKLWPDGNRSRIRAWVEKQYERDAAAYAWFWDKANTGGVQLPPQKVLEYTVNASVLNTCIRLYDRASVCQRMFGSRYNWDEMAAVIDTLRELYGHTLPASTLRFRKKVAQYRRLGYAALVSGKFGNQSARKVDQKLERLLLSIAVQPNKPFNTDVWEQYMMFVTGEFDVYDRETGELFNPDDFTDRNGEPLEISKATVANYLNLPKNRVLIDHAQMSGTTFMHEVMPHVHRHAPEFSLSKISFDDRDLPRKLRDTKQRPKAYYAYDVASQCVVGYAYSRRKDTDLVSECFRSMFRLIDRMGWGCPAQVEVENHLMTQWRDSFLKAGVLFPFVRFCAPQNSQEKYAEQMNGAKKRSVEHRNHLGIGRFYARDRHYRTEARKVFDEKNDTYEDPEYYTWEQLIAEDMRDIEQFNHSLHPNQKRYPGLTRWQVLVQNLNPTLQPLDRAICARYVGEHVSTSVRRNSYCRVQGRDWWISRTEVIERLEPNNWQVEAYYLTNEEGQATDVWIYQGDTLIDKLEDVGTFNTADAEQTDLDRAVFTAQQHKIAHFRSYVAQRAVTPVGVSAPSAPPSPPGPPGLPATVPGGSPAGGSLPDSPPPLTVPGGSPAGDSLPDPGYVFKDETDALADL